MPAIDWGTVIEYFSYQPERPMIFSSALFLTLFLAFYALYLSVKDKVVWRNIYVLFFSLYFYYLSSGWYFVLLLFSSIVDFALGHFIANAATQNRKKIFLWLSISVNLGLLFYFKYTNFFLASMNDIFGSNFALQKIFLPVGISFYTFQTLSYSIDVYRGKITPLTAYVKDAKSLLAQFGNFAFFVSFFPQLVAGPIVRAADFLPQLLRPSVLTRQQMSQGFWLIIGGLFKKAIISDYISVNFVDRVFAEPAKYSGLENLFAVYGYAVQIYCDFSGYSDMAIGLALLLGFTLPENFRKPYQSASIREFWQRWHISLSSWLRDYLYISLGGNRKGNIRTYINLMLTMLLGGLWHGASWVFIVWGALHGMALAVDRWLSQQLKWAKLESTRILLIIGVIQLVSQLVIMMRFANYDPYLYQVLSTSNMWIVLVFGGIYGLGRLLNNRVAAVVMTFHFVAFCWVFFRAGALHATMPPMDIFNAVLGQILSNFQPELWPQFWAGYYRVILLIALGFALHTLPLQWDKWGEQQFAKQPLVVQGIALGIAIWLVIQVSNADVVPFIYFQF